MEITIDEFIKRFNDNANHELTLGNLQGCLEFRQLAKWLEKYQKIDEIVKAWNDMNSFDSMKQISEVLEDG